jgi:hypothetical protein
MPDNHLNFVYKLEGDVKEIDIFKLAPTLLAMGELIQQSNRELNPNGPEVGVNVKPFREGSFIVDLTLFQDSNFRQLFNFLTPHSLEQLKQLLEIIGLIGTGAGVSTVGVVKAIKFLRGKPKSVTEIQPGEFRLTTIDDRSITVDRSTHLLMQNSSIVNNIYKVYGDPMDAQPNIEDVKTYLRDDESSVVKVKRDEVLGFREFISPSASPDDAREIVKDTTQVGVLLNPKRGAFGDDPKDWSFYRGDEVITATIRDKDFLAQCANGDVRLNHNDLLTVDLLARQRVKGTQVLKTTYEILKVTGYERGLRQASFIE